MSRRLTGAVSRPLEIIRHYGLRAQLDHMRKESVELAHALDRYLDGKDSFDHVEEEMADVLLLACQVMEYLEIEDRINAVMDMKVDRTLSHIEGRCD